MSQSNFSNNVKSNKYIYMYVYIIYIVLHANDLNQFCMISCIIQLFHFIVFISSLISGYIFCLVNAKIIVTHHINQIHKRHSVCTHTCNWVLPDKQILNIEAFYSQITWNRRSCCALLCVNIWPHIPILVFAQIFNIWFCGIYTNQIFLNHTHFDCQVKTISSKQYRISWYPLIETTGPAIVLMKHMIHSHDVATGVNNHDLAPAVTFAYWWHIQTCRNMFIHSMRCIAFMSSTLMAVSPDTPYIYCLTHRLFCVQHSGIIYRYSPKCFGRLRSNHLIIAYRKAVCYIRSHAKYSHRCIVQSLVLTLCSFFQFGVKDYIG